MKKYYVLAAIALALSSCQQDEFLGDVPGHVQSNYNTAISFGGETGKITRAGEKTNADAATLLNNAFVVYGTKTVNNAEQKVFDSYKVSWTTGNSSGSWGYDNTDGQSIKYWDYSASQYDFVAYSVGNTTGVTASEVSTSGYKLSGKVQDLLNCYIADGVKVEKNNDYKNPVKFTFRPIGAKVAIGIFETIPGYSINKITFYSAEGTTVTENTASMYTTSEVFQPNTGDNGTLIVTIAEDKKATATLSITGSENKSTSISFGTFTLNAAKEKNEADENKYMGREYANATKTEDITVFPCNITAGLTLKVDYTLISTDGSGETINVKGATVSIPNTYTNWVSNTKYTYIFNITEKTNGSTGDNAKGLYPITFNAVVTETGSQTTKTTFVADGTETTTKEVDAEGKEISSASDTPAGDSAGV